MTHDEAALAHVLDGAHRASAAELPGLIEDGARRLGLTRAVMYLADLQQITLVPLLAPDASPDDPVDIESSLGGLAYRTQQVQRARDGAVAWVPMIDGIERIGVMKVTAPVLTPPLLERATALASLATLIVLTKAAHDDVIVRQERTRPMTIQAELLWAFLPPRTIGTRDVTSAAVLEPAYAIGGDAFDHNFGDGVLHQALLDAMGHDLASGGASAAALAAYRATRRAGGSLGDIAVTIDRTLSRWIPGRLMTAVLVRFDPARGVLSWVNCGHPPPLLIRDKHVLPSALQRPADLPLGFGFHAESPPAEHHARLQPRDRVLFYSDGVTEARSTAGEQFGEQRLADTIIRTMAAGDTAPEALRRLIQRLRSHKDHRLNDDATILLTEWHPA
ncbi:PP2C family protein-serine/threonine phosphatase [Streptomyces sp. NPDC048111]|uniref:PP2C family protein-serine/threonine phosphatase n=1 Tax=Streptomyces sp. NPDC048111 TaxID=3365500 RepID=UPI003719321A